MREAYFVKKNHKKWELFEAALEKKVQLHPEELSKLYLELTDDLSYAKSFYPESKTITYLNSLASRAHLKIYKTKKESKNRLTEFYKIDFPLMFFNYQKHLGISFAVFFFFFLVGAFSASENIDFVRLILGDAYVNMTLENIDNGDPMAVYKKANELSMTSYITFNNIRVAGMAFLYGMLFCVGTLYIMMQNGIMLGSFTYFFYHHDLLWESSRTIWIHGTLEISVIIVASCAGLVAGSGLIFPGTYSRLESFKRSFKDGLKIMLSTVPFFIVAGFLEGFITRYTDMPDFMAITIISISLFVIVFYYIIYPRLIYQTQSYHE